MSGGEEGGGGDPPHDGSVAGAVEASSQGDTTTLTLTQTLADCWVIVYDFSLLLQVLKDVLQ